MSNITYKQQQFNVLAYPEWKRVGGIDTIDVENENNQGSTLIEGLSYWKNSGAKVYHISQNDSDINDLYYHKFAKELEEIDNLKYGSNDKYVLEGELYFGTGHILEVPNGVTIDKPLVIRYGVGETKDSLIDQTFIYMGKDSNATVVIVYHSEDSESFGYHNGLTKVFAGEGSNLKLIKIQVFNDLITHIDNSVSLIEKDGHVEFSSFDFGASKVVTDYSSHLVGDDGKSTVVTAYIGDGNRKLDIGYNTVHYGKRTESLIDCKGALLDEAKKIFRGNLKFQKGAKKSVGRESEFVLLLDPRVHSDAIPALLCDEDDVIGEHAASAGQVDEQQLFYIMSRGFSLKEAKKLVIHGSFSNVIDCLPTSELKDLVELELERRLLNA